MTTPTPRARIVALVTGKTLVAVVRRAENEDSAAATLGGWDDGPIDGAMLVLEGPSELHQVPYPVVDQLTQQPKLAGQNLLLSYSVDRLLVRRAHVVAISDGAGELLELYAKHRQLVQERADQRALSAPARAS